MTTIDDIKQLSTTNPTMSNSDIAIVIGCSRSYVSLHRIPKTHSLCKTCGAVIYGKSSKEYCKHSCRPSHYKSKANSMEARRRYEEAMNESRGQEAN